jgi:uncharacterized protein YyaL (SSP411 family)
VAWEEWGPAAFARAKAEDRLLLVSVGAAWCHWCHVMDRETWGDAGVAALLAEGFVCVRADADARPDVAERYAEWGWPATAVLTPDARPVLERRGYQEPRGFAALLRRLLDEHRAGRPLAREPAPPPAVHAGPLEVSRVLAEETLDGWYDTEHAGWGTRQKYPLPAPVENAFLRARLRGKAAWVHPAADTLRAEMALLDPVWGGMYQYSEGGVWTRPHFEKIAAVQAGALENFAEGYRATGDESFLRAAREVERYVLEFLRGPDGAFFVSQDADAGAHGDGPYVEGRLYFAEGDAGRRRLGMPRVDRAIYAEANGLLVAGLCRLHEATGDRATLDAARAAAERVVATHAAPGGGYFHAAGGSDPLLHLADQVALGRAFLLLHDASNPFDGAAAERARWLDRARGVARVLGERLEDREGGGFFAATADPGARGVFAERRKPFEENARAVRFLIGLARRTGEASFTASAERALRAVGGAEAIRAQGRFVGDYLLALEEAAAPEVRMTIAAREGKDAAALYAAALRVYDPLKVIEVEAPGATYPDTGRPAVYVCDDGACSAPISDPAELRRYDRRHGR